MVQLNLLPDVKVQFIKARRVKRLMISVSLIVGAASLALLLIMFVAVNVVQKKSLSDVSSDITKYSSQLKAVPDLNKILTVQNQLSTLTELHDQKPVASRLFTYIAQLTPTKASLTDTQIDLEQNTISVSGTATGLDVVSAYTDTLKAATYTTGSSKDPHHAFSSVVLSTFSRADSKASFTITATFDPVIFQSNSDVTLSVPTSNTDNQSQLFGGTR